MAECNVQNLMDSARSFAGLTYQQLEAIQAQLLCDIAAAGGGGGGGSGSVTSAEVQTISNAVSAETVNRVGADNALSAAINLVSAAAGAAEIHASAASAAATSADGHANTVSARVVSVSAELASLVQIASVAAISADTHANTASAAATSVDGRVNSINAFISGISARSVGNVSTHGFQSVINALSNRISAAGGGTGSVTSTEVSAVSAQAASAINVVSARVVSVSAELASLVQIASAAATSADTHANTVSARVVSVSAELASLVQIASAAATSVDARVNSVNTFISGISARSAGNISTHGFQSVINALSGRLVSIVGGGAGSGLISIEKTERISADIVIQNSIAANSALIANVSTVSGGGTAVGLQSVINALSNRISAIPGAGSVNVVGRVSVAQVICAAVLTDISGMTVSVSTGVLYELRGQIMYSVSAATGNAFGLTFPAMTNAAGDIWGIKSVNPISAVSAFSLYIPGSFDGGDSGSAVWSCEAVGIAGLHVVHIAGTFLVSTGGVIVPQARASVATNAVTIARGSWMRAFKLS